MALDGPHPHDTLTEIQGIPVAVNSALLNRLKNLVIERGEAGLTASADLDPWTVEFGLSGPE